MAKTRVDPSGGGTPKPKKMGPPASAFGLKTLKKSTATYKSDAPKPWPPNKVTFKKGARLDATQATDKRTAPRGTPPWDERNPWGVGSPSPGPAPKKKTTGIPAVRRKRMV